MIFPVLCPECHADSGVRIVPASPEVEAFRCGDCRHEWSEAARAQPPAQRVGSQLDRRWLALFPPHAHTD